MSNAEEYCDDCADPVTEESRCIITHLPVAVDSANEGESATLCRDCFSDVWAKAVKAHFAGWTVPQDYLELVAETAAECGDVEKAVAKCAETARSFGRGA